MLSSTTSESPLNVAICGGGLGGLALAIGLLHRPHIMIHIYESAHAFAEIGAGVSFGPNSRRAMAMIDEKIMRGYERVETTNMWEEKKETYFDFRVGMQGEEKQGLRVGEKFCEVRSKGNVGNSSVHRAHFLDELVKMVPKGDTSFGKRLEDIEELEQGGLRLHFHDGSTAKADAVIGCDGIKSRTRQVLLGFNNPASHAVFTGKHAYRGLIPMEKAVEVLGDELARNSQMYFGEHGHVLTFPIEKGRTMNVVAFHRTKSGIWEDEAWVKSMKMEDMMSEFAGWSEDVRKILSLMEHPDIWAIFNMLPAETFFRGRIALLGDAAHASTPHQGAGAGMAMEDAYVLSSLMGETHKASDIEKAFEAYDHVRRPRAQKLVNTSYDAGLLYDYEAKDFGDDVGKISQNLKERWKWIWDIDLIQHLEEAKTHLRSSMVS